MINFWFSQFCSRQAPRFRSGQGFTLFELMVVISIIAIMAVIAIPGFRGYTQRAYLRDSANQIRSALLEAQAYSLAPVKATAESYEISFPQAGTAGSFFIKEIPGDQEIKKFNLPNSATYIKSYTLDGVSKDLVVVKFKTSSSRSITENTGIEIDPKGSNLRIEVGYFGLNINYFVNLNTVTGQVSLSKT